MSQITALQKKHESKNGDFYHFFSLVIRDDGVRVCLFFAYYSAQVSISRKVWIDDMIYILESFHGFTYVEQIFGEYLSEIYNGHMCSHSPSFLIFYDSDKRERILMLASCSSSPFSLPSHSNIRIGAHLCACVYFVFSIEWLRQQAWDINNIR